MLGYLLAYSDSAVFRVDCGIKMVARPGWCALLSQAAPSGGSSNTDTPTARELEQLDEQLLQGELQRLYARKACSCGGAGVPFLGSLLRATPKPNSVAGRLSSSARSNALAVGLASSSLYMLSLLL